MSGFDPKRTWAAQNCCLANWPLNRVGDSKSAFGANADIPSSRSFLRMNLKPWAIIPGFFFGEERRSWMPPSVPSALKNDLTQHSQPGQGSTFAFTLPVIVERQVEGA
jgi:hypothetical protein